MSPAYGRLFHPAHSNLRHTPHCQERKAWFTVSLFDQKAQGGKLPQCLGYKLLGLSQISVRPGMASWLNVCTVTQMRQQT